MGNLSSQEELKAVGVYFDDDGVLRRLKTNEKYNPENLDRHKVIEINTINLVQEYLITRFGMKKNDAQ